MAEDLFHKTLHAPRTEEGRGIHELKAAHAFPQDSADAEKELEDIERTVHTMQDEATVFADPNDRASQETDIAIELRNRDRERKLIKKTTPWRVSRQTTTAL